MSKLGIKLLIVILAISLGGLVIVSIFINASINQNFENYLHAKNEEQIEELISFLKNNYDENLKWNDDFKEIEKFVQTNRLKFYLEDKYKNLVYSNYEKGIMRGKLSQNRDIKKFDLRDEEGNNIGTLYWMIPPRKNLFSQSEHIFLKQINQVIYYTAGLIALITIVISFFLSKYLTAPLLKIENAAQKVAKGDFSKRVEVRGDDELSQLGKAFNDMAIKLSQLEETRQESISNFAHELRTPITNINNYIEAVEDGVINLDHTTITEIKEELYRLINLVNRLKDLNDAEEKIINIQKEKLNITALIKNIVKKHKLSAKKKNVSINENYSDSKVLFRGDKEALKTIFNNLLSNAVKYTNKNGEIKILVHSNANIVIEIRNTGEGISREDLPYIFERFFRADKSRSKEGSGVGLTITKKLIEAHNGKIEVESIENLTIFTINLPL